MASENETERREALMQVSLSCSACPRHNCKGCTRPFASFMPTVRKALSAHARNCDRFADELDAQLAFLNEVWLISVGREEMLERDKYENWTDEMRTRYSRWLLAPAAERKG